MPEDAADTPLAAMAPKGALGVLGGMGPAATADFLHRLAEVTPAKRDQDHIPVVMYADPTTPDRSDAVERGGEDPLPKLLAGIRFLDAAGVEAIAIPCNSAHLWYDQMQAATEVPILHIADAVIRALEDRLAPGGTVGLLGTEGTLRSRLYQDRLEAAGYATVTPSDEEELDQLMRGIRSVKAGDVASGRVLLSVLASRLVQRGAHVIVVACTDISVAFAATREVDGHGLIDANTELALVSSKLSHTPDSVLDRPRPGESVVPNEDPTRAGPAE